MVKKPIEAPSQEVFKVKRTFTATIPWGARQYRHRFLAGQTYRIVDDDADSPPVAGTRKTIQRSAFGALDIPK